MHSPEKKAIDNEKMSEAEIDLNIMETFPASDPPSWTLGIGPNRKPHQDLDSELSQDEET